MDVDLDKHNSVQLPGTCQWFFDNPTYRDWRAASCSQPLCLRGVPGSGKSVASASLIRHLQRDVAQNIPVLYFFCKKNDQDRDSTSKIIRTLLLQLASLSAHGPEFADILHRERSSGVAATDYSRRQLWGILQTMLDIIPAVYVVLDALDECSKHEELRELLEEFIAYSVTSGKVVKVFVTYRPNEFETSWPSIDIEERDVEADIRAYASHRIDNSRTLSLPIHKQRIFEAIRERAGGTFLWVKLMLDILNDSSPRQIQDVLTDVPRGLSSTYDLMLTRVCNGDPRAAERCRKVLHWCVVARRLLTVDELLLALAVSEGASSHEQYDEETDLPDALRILRLECGSLIHVLKDNTVQLLHTSLREYLLYQTRMSSDEYPTTTSTMQLTDVNTVHKDLAMICLRYNQFACFQEALDMDQLELYEKRFPLSRYAICTWIYHVYNSGDSHSFLSDALATFLDSAQGWRWLERCHYFHISGEGLQILQTDLEAWIQRRCDGQNGTTTLGPLRSFMLHLGHTRYKEAPREKGAEDELAAAEFQLGLTNDELGQYGEALKWYERALAGYVKAFGNEHPSTLATVHNIASVYHGQGSYTEALERYERALAGYVQALGKDHPSTLDTVHNMADVYSSQGCYTKALEWYKRALAGYEQALGKDHPSTLTTAELVRSTQEELNRPGLNRSASETTRL